MATDYQALIERLATAGVDFLIVGGVAVVAHGYPRFTRDLDICYARDPANLDRLAAALAPLNPYLRGAPRGLPFTLDAATLRSGLNFILTTDGGDLDLLGELTGVGGYAELSPNAVEIEAFGRRVRLIHLDDLERAKRAAGRPQDLFDLEAIRAIREREKS